MISGPRPSPALLCWFTHRFHHVVMRREGDCSTLGCARCEHKWQMPRFQEPQRLARQATIDAAHSGNPYDLTDYAATRDGYDPGEPDGDGGYTGGDPIGRGDTRWAAIRDLLEQEAEPRWSVPRPVKIFAFGLLAIPGAVLWLLMSFFSAFDRPSDCYLDWLCEIGSRWGLIK